MISGDAAEREGSQDEKEKGQPPPDERAQALSPVISPRAPIVEGAQAPTPELSLRAAGQDASSWMAGPLSVKVVMKEGREEITVLGLGPLRLTPWKQEPLR